MEEIRDLLSRGVNLDSNPATLTESLLNFETISSYERGNLYTDMMRREMSRFDEWMSPRTINQMRFCEAMLRTSSSYIYQGCFEQQKESICKRNKWKRIFPALGIQAPRREGKTEMAKLFGAAAAYVMPSVHILIVVPEARMGDKTTGLLGGMYKNLRELFGVKNFISSKAQFLSFEREGTVREIRMESSR